MTDESAAVGSARSSTMTDRRHRDRAFFHSVLTSAAMLACLLTVVTTAIGSSAGPPILDATEKKLLEIFGQDVVVSGSDTKVDRKSLVARMLQPQAAKYIEYQDGTRRNLEITTSKAARTPPKWPKTDGDPMIVRTPGQSTNWIIRVGDELAMPAQIDLTQSVSIRYDPPEPTLHAGPDPAPIDMSVKVYDIHGTGAPEHAGSLRVTSVDRGVHRITTPAGAFDVVMFRNDYRGSIGPASVDDTSLIFVSPTHGVVASVQRKKVSAMIFYNKDTRLGYALREVEKADG